MTDNFSETSYLVTEIFHNFHYVRLFLFVGFFFLFLFNHKKALPEISIKVLSANLWSLLYPASCELRIARFASSRFGYT